MGELATAVTLAGRYKILVKQLATWLTITHEMQEEIRQKNLRIAELERDVHNLEMELRAAWAVDSEADCYPERFEPC